jgi:hypothetical protein
MIDVTFPMRTVSEANRRGHWSKHSGRTKGQREAAGLVVQAESQKLYQRRSSTLMSVGAQWPMKVTLARLAPRDLDDDNLRGALKAVRDGVADALGIDDRDPRVTWLYAQEKAKGYAVRITITRREA